jgi:hypothetical protein
MLWGIAAQAFFFSRGRDEENSEGVGWNREEKEAGDEVEHQFCLLIRSSNYIVTPPQKSHSLLNDVYNSILGTNIHSFWNMMFLFSLLLFPMTTT